MCSVVQFLETDETHSCLCPMQTEDEIVLLLSAFGVQMSDLALFRFARLPVPPANLSATTQEWATQKRPSSDGNMQCVFIPLLRLPQSPDVKEQYVLSMGYNAATERSIEAYVDGALEAWNRAVALRSDLPAHLRPFGTKFAKDSGSESVERDRVEIVKEHQSVFKDGISVSYGEVQFKSRAVFPGHTEHGQKTKHPLLVGLYSCLPGYSGAAIFPPQQLVDFRKANHGHLPLYAIRP